LPSSPPISHWKLAWWRLKRNRVALAAGGIFFLIVLAAVFAPVIAPYDPDEASLNGFVINRLAPIGSPGHLLGTDEQGRDMLSRLLYGGRVTLLSGIIPVLVALVAGSMLGVTAGFMGGKTNMAIMRTMDIFYAFPSILLAIAIAGALGPGTNNAIISLSLIFTPSITRIAESVTTGIRDREFIEAARAGGASSFTIMRHHVLANVISPIVVYASTLVGVSILIASGLSFLGLGVAPPTPEWGLMLNTLRQSVYLEPWVPLLPGVMIFITSMCFNLLSDGLRDAMDVRS
jgi:peptide/nickel transport system permease protein